VGESVRLAVETGVAGLSIEDSTGDPAHPLFPIDEAVARMRAARNAIDAAGGDTLLVGRAECSSSGSGSRRDHRAPARLRERRRRLPLCARHSHSASTSRRSWKQWRPSR
jgi:isocitrate lyase